MISSRLRAWWRSLTTTFGLDLVRARQDPEGRTDTGRNDAAGTSADRDGAASRPSRRSR